MALDVFSPPGFVDDLSERGLQAWSRDLDELLTEETQGDPETADDSPRPQFFNLLGVELDTDATEKAMRWTAFPRKLARLAAPERWQLGEERDRQEEYCEWSAERDRNGRIIRAFFTTEVPGYYHLLAADDPERLANVYRDHISESIRPCELISSGRYVERNRWNLQGAMHMIQGANTLPAATTLVAQSTIVRSDGERLLTNANDLIRCGVIADMDRNSDPLIVSDVNSLARAHAAISFADPVGLYLNSLQTAGWASPDGADPASFWKITRGDPDHAVRAVYQVPPELDFTVSDITINDRPITSPSQIAEFIQVKVVGLAHGFDKHRQDPRPCSGRGGILEAAGGLERAEDLPRIKDLIAAARHGR
jgi:hypothetical protein